MKDLILGIGILLLWSNLSIAANLADQNSPSALMTLNPDLKEKSIARVLGSDQFTDKERQVLIDLFNGEEGQGDGLLEELRPETLAWFYGQKTTVKAKDPLLYKSARVGGPSQQAFQDCRNRTVCVLVSKREQRMYAWFNGVEISGVHGVKISTARPGKLTPTGYFSVEELAHAGRTSRKYPGAGLFWAMQLHGHIFIHGTNKKNYRKLGTAASAGCVRTRTKVAGILNNIMRDAGGRTQRGLLSDTSQVRVLITSMASSEFMWSPTMKSDIFNEEQDFLGWPGLY